MIRNRNATYFFYFIFYSLNETKALSKIQNKITCKIKISLLFFFYILPSLGYLEVDFCQQEQNPIRISATIIYISTIYREFLCYSQILEQMKQRIRQTEPISYRVCLDVDRKGTSQVMQHEVFSKLNLTPISQSLEHYKLLAMLKISLIISRKPEIQNCLGKELK